MIASIINPVTATPRSKRAGFHSLRCDRVGVIDDLWKLFSSPPAFPRVLVERDIHEVVVGDPPTSAVALVVVARRLLTADDIAR